MYNTMSVRNIIDSMIPISRFNRGEANKIFNEVKTGGAKIVVKNNSPECVLLSPEDYKQLAEQAENYALLIEAETRMRNTNLSDSITQEDLMKKYSITEDDLSDVEVEFD